MPVIASRDYSPGDVIYVEESYVQVLPRNLKDILCEWCGKRPKILRACKQCLAVKYCEKSCQKNDWSTHRLECLHLKNLPVCKTVNFVRFLGKLILKIKGKDWKTIKHGDSSFDDVDSHHKAMAEIPLLQLLYKEMKYLTEQYIGKENMPSDEDLLAIIGKLRCHEVTPQGLFFFIGSSKFDLECIPNANAVPCGRNMKIWAIKKIKKGVDKISIPARQMLSSQITDLFAHDKSPCKCTDCSLPHGESVLYKILDDKRAFSVVCEANSLLNLSELVLDTRDLMGNVLLEKVVDNLLQDIKGVLGNSNHLYLRLLAIKCLKIGGPADRIKQSLMELEANMRSVFGELYYEMAKIYDALALLHYSLGNHEEYIRHLRKAEAINVHQTG